MSLPSAPASLSAGTANTLAADARSLNALKYAASSNDPQAVRAAAKQFESLFMRELIKSMREATMKSGLLDGPQGNLGADLLDQQLSVQMAGQPGGLSDAIVRQLSQQMGGGSGDTALSVPSTLSLAASRTRFAGAGAVAASANAGAAAPAGREGFVQFHRAAAERVAQESGIPAHFMLGQAGHETGWGKSEIRQANGSPSYNLFGIKAGKGWTGKVATVTTTEYEGGVARKVVAKFRAYDSYEDAFHDYARLINDNPRYAAARAKVGSAVAYAAELQKAGYATDPAYARKLSSAIHSAQGVQRS
ncbi:flagellar assembly peptidoglycan hydrolase FlgJ [Extensimonas sp. H3M7-6]|uniref:flagellar assembly peptidoglycan hydrolase FlgJ n=1 Tax=Extensimonas soli TaxID=3031322 RepID=UPI0023DAF3F1|nr:flagellar assembly peptidoglycan hydrolase FlgJ [Extensimonas sp. H3M7-6]MDF1482191.1 flagellar assembly peptidoglycan hydrolase FlgJ [Extensimonas sp. H3M7-6]